MFSAKTFYIPLTQYVSKPLGTLTPKMWKIPNPPLTAHCAAQVVDRAAPGRGVTGWCRAATNTTCSPLGQVRCSAVQCSGGPAAPPAPQGSVDYQVNSSLVQLHFGTLDSGAQPLLCTTQLAE